MTNRNAEALQTKESASLYEPLTTQPTSEPAGMSRSTVLRLLYFLQTGAAAGLIKFLPVFFDEIGYSATAIGTLILLMYILTFFGGIFWGRLADQTHEYKAILVGTSAVSVTSTTLMGLSFIQHSHALLTGCFSCFSFFGSCAGTLVDAIAVINQSKGSSSYGQLRLFAALGWGTMAIGSGYLVDEFNINVIFIVFAIGMVLSIGIVLCSMKDPHTDDDVPSPQQDDKEKLVDADALTDASPEVEQPISLWPLLCRVEVILLLINLLNQGILIAFVESFLFLYLETVYDTPRIFMGLCTMEAVLFELPVFYYSQQLINKIGVVGLLTLAQFLYATRVWAYTVVPTDNYYLFLLLEPFHAFVFAAMWSAAVEYSRRIAPVSHQGVMQALVRGVYYSIGGGVGAVIGGVLIDSKGSDTHGYHFMYHTGAVLMVLWSFVWHFLLFINRRCQPKEGASPINPGC